jgi:hypothetical protein
MDPDVVILAGLFGAILSLGVAGYYYCAAFEQARTSFPAALQGELAARYAMDTLIWTPAVPALARRNYLRSHVYAGVAFACLAMVAFEHASSNAALLFGGIAAFAIALTLRCWRKLRSSA